MDLSSFLQIKSASNRVVILASQDGILFKSIPFHYPYCCRGSSFPVFVSHSFEARTRTMLTNRRKFTCRFQKNGLIASLGFPLQYVSLTVSYNNGCQDRDLIDPLQVSSTDVPAAEIRSIMTIHDKCIMQILDTSANDSLCVCQ